MKKVISVIIVIIWMSIVFLFSSEVGDESKVTSGNTIRRIITFLNNDIDNIRLEKIVEFLQPITRKFAHFTLYTIGGISIFNMYKSFNMKINKVTIFSVLTGVVYSITDEIHQIFVPGRSGMVKDVVIDSFGVATGILICIIFLKIINTLTKTKIKE